MTETLLNFIKTYENGVTEEQILIMNPSLTKESLVKHLNTLIKNSSITVYKNGSTIFYKAVTNASDDYESLIINLISQSGVEGMWIKEIREKTNMPHNLVLKMLGNLESKRVIKSIKNIKNNRKVYVLFDIIPSDEVTGGFWFTDNDVDVECVENVSKIVYNYLKKKTFVDSENALNKYSTNPSLSEITEYVNTLNFLNSKVKDEEMRYLVNTMVYDDKIELLMDEGVERFRGVMLEDETNGYLLNVKCHERPITDLKFNKDGDLLFTSSKDSTCTVIYTDGTPLGSYSGHDGSIFTISLSDSSKNMLSGSADQTIIHWDLETGKKNKQIFVKSVVKTSDNFKDDNLFVIGCDGSMGKDRCIMLYDVRTKECNKLSSLELNPTGVLIDYTQKYIIISNDDGSMSKYDTRNNKILNTANIHTSKITRIKPSRCRTFLVSASVDAQAKIVDIEDLSTVKTFVCEEPVNCAVIFGTNDKVVCVGGINARDVTTSKGKNKFDTKFYDVITTEQVGYYTSHYGTIHCVDVHHEGYMYASGGEEGLVSIIKFGEDFYEGGFTKFIK